MGTSYYIRTHMRYNTMRHQTIDTIQSDINFSANKVDSMWFEGLWFSNDFRCFFSSFLVLWKMFMRKSDKQVTRILIYVTIKSSKRDIYFTISQQKGSGTTSTYIHACIQIFIELNTHKHTRYRTEFLPS